MSAKHTAKAKVFDYPSKRASPSVLSADQLDKMQYPPHLLVGFDRAELELLQAKPCTLTPEQVQQRRKLQNKISAAGARERGKTRVDELQYIVNDLTVQLEDEKQRVEDHSVQIRFLKDQVNSLLCVLARSNAFADNTALNHSEAQVDDLAAFNYQPMDDALPFDHFLSLSSIPLRPELVENLYFANPKAGLLNQAYMMHNSGDSRAGPVDAFSSQAIESTQGRTRGQKKAALAAKQGNGPADLNTATGKGAGRKRKSLAVAVEGEAVSAPHTSFAASKNDSHHLPLEPTGFESYLGDFAGSPSSVASSSPSYSAAPSSPATSLPGSPMQSNPSSPLHVAGRPKLVRKRSSNYTDVSPHASITTGALGSHAAGIFATGNQMAMQQQKMQSVDTFSLFRAASDSTYPHLLAEHSQPLLENDHLTPLPFVVEATTTMACSSYPLSFDLPLAHLTNAASHHQSWYC